MYTRDRSSFWYSAETKKGFLVRATLACADQKWITLSRYRPNPMITASTRRNKTSAVCKEENPNCAVKMGPSRKVNTPRNVPIVKTIPMMLLLKFQRYSHSAARIFCCSAVMPVPEPCMADGRIFEALALAIQAGKKEKRRGSMRAAAPAQEEGNRYPAAASHR